jgi:glycerate dehydrogenase
MEIWNNVFSQFNNDGKGNYTELAQKNIDTGMGLERLACVMQGVDNLFEVDTVRKLLDTVCEIAGKTWGILGAGNIGRQVARVAEAFGCRVIVCRRTSDPDYPTVDVDTLCREADILSVHTPLTDETRGIISRERIAMMKPGAIFVNVARGAVADEAALADAVREGRLGGIGIDVYTEEPFPETHPLYDVRDLPNVCLTPHMAWGAFEARQRCLDEIAENIRAHFAGERRSRVD